MISHSTTRSGARVTFSVAAKTPVSVVADFNGWDPIAHPLRSRGEGVRSVTVSLAPGSYAFRYLADGGLFFDDPDADEFESNSHGGTHGLVRVPELDAPTKRVRKSARAAKTTDDAAPKAPRSSKRRTAS